MESLIRSIGVSATDADVNNLSSRQLEEHQVKLRDDFLYLIQSLGIDPEWTAKMLPGHLQILYHFCWFTNTNNASCFITNILHKSTNILSM